MSNPSDRVSFSAVLAVTQAQAQRAAMSAPAPGTQADTSRAWAGPDCEAAINERGPRPDSWAGGFRHGWSEGRAPLIDALRAMVEADEKWAFCELHPSAVDKLDRTIAAIARTKARIEAEEILSRASAIRTSNV